MCALRGVVHVCACVCVEAASHCSLLQQLARAGHCSVAHLVCVDSHKTHNSRLLHCIEMGT